MIYYKFNLPLNGNWNKLFVCIFEIRCILETIFYYSTLSQSSLFSQVLGERKCPRGCRPFSNQSQLSSSTKNMNEIATWNIPLFCKNSLSVMKTLVKNSMHAEQRKICTAVLFLVNKYTTQPQSHKSQQFCCSIIVSSKQWLSYISVNLTLNSYIPLP